MDDGVAGRRSFWFDDAPQLVTAINSLTPLVVLPQNMFQRICEVIGVATSDCSDNTCVFNKPCDELNGPPISIKLADKYYQFTQNDYFIAGP